MARAKSLLRLFCRLFRLHDLQRQHPEPLEQGDIFLQVAIQPPQIKAPVDVHDPVAKADHFGHLSGILIVQIAGLGQDEEDISLFFQSAQPIHRDNVVPYVGATLGGSLERSFDRQLYRKVSLKLLETERLLPP